MCCALCVARGYRIIEIEWAVKNDKAFVPSPKPAKKSKGKKKKSKNLKDYPMSDEQTGVDEEDYKQGESESAGGDFGHELTNASILNTSKRTLADLDGDDDTETTPKRQRRSRKTKAVVMESSEGEDWIPPALAKKGKRKLQS